MCGKFRAEGQWPKPTGGPIASRQRGETLAANPQLLDDGFIPFGTDDFDVGQKPAPFGDHDQQSPTGRVIFLMSLEVLGELGDALTQDCNLHFWRSSIGFVCPIAGNDLLLAFSRQCHF